MVFLLVALIIEESEDLMESLEEVDLQKANSVLICITLILVTKLVDF